MQEQILLPQQKPQIKKGNKGKFLLIGIGVIGLGTAGYFISKKLRKKPKEVLDNQGTEDTENFTPPVSSPKIPKPSHTITSGNENKSFPLKKGSSGERVKSIQKILAAKGFLDEKDVIGQFGPKTEAALIKAGYSAIIDEALFNTITAGKKNPADNATPPAAPPTPPAPIDAARFARALYACAKAKNFKAAVTLLRLMKTTADYTAVSEIFKMYFLNGVRQTLVNGMLSTFTSIDQKTEMQKAFLNMGLKYDGIKFTLSGLSGRGLITTGSTTVYDQNLSGTRVPVNTILGTEAGKRGEYTQFKNKGRYFLVPTANINYL
jgi:hypothetical protein